MCNWLLNCCLCRSSDSSQKDGSGSGQSSKDFQKEVLKAHNDYRALHGVPPLVLDKDLCKLAVEWAKVRRNLVCVTQEKLHGKGTLTLTIDHNLLHMCVKLQRL